MRVRAREVHLGGGAEREETLRPEAQHTRALVRVSAHGFGLGGRGALGRAARLVVAHPTVVRPELRRRGGRNEMGRRGVQGGGVVRDGG